MKNAFQLILKVLQEELGLVILGDESDDFPICDYIPDSITFVQFIISIEEKIGINLTDDFLDFELLSSTKGFSEEEISSKNKIFRVQNAAVFPFSKDFLRNYISESKDIMMIDILVK